MRAKRSSSGIKSDRTLFDAPDCFLSLFISGKMSATSEYVHCVLNIESYISQEVCSFHRNYY